MKSKPVVVLSFIVALGLIALALSYKNGGGGGGVVTPGGALKYEKNAAKPEEEPTLGQGSLPAEPGKAGSAHTHISLVLFVNNEAFNFFDEKYMLRSDLVHFENDDGITVHKHATGVTISHFFKTLGMELTKDCLTLHDGLQYCTNGVEKLSFLVNGAETDPDQYEIGDGDRVLINYGNDDRVALRLKMNNVPKVPDDILKGEGG